MKTKSQHKNNRRPNRLLKAAAGVVVLLTAGSIYAWSVMSKSISAARPDWTSAALSFAFTLAMIFFCLGGILSGFLSRKIKPKVIIALSAAFLFAGYLIASFTGDSPILLYSGFGVLASIGAGFSYNCILSSIQAWFPERQGLISWVHLLPRDWALSALSGGLKRLVLGVDDPIETSNC